QTVETVNESVQDRQRNLFSRGFREEEWRNRLIWGDKKYVLPSLLSEFAGKVNLIYIDPPFDTGADFSFTATVPDDPDSEKDGSFAFTKEPSIIEHKAYRDIWGGAETHRDAYLKWFNETLISLFELLNEAGSLFVHLDSNAVHYAKVILDEIFGDDGFRNEIIWKRRYGSFSTVHESNKFGAVTDTILFYAKSAQSEFHPQYSFNDPSYNEYVERTFRHVDEKGRRYRIADLANPTPRPNLMYEYKGYKPPPNGWAISREKMELWDEEGRLHFPKDKSGRIQRRRFFDELKGKPVQSLWDDIDMISSQDAERVGYPTQKPEALLKRIVEAASSEGQLVLDCFCGSGTTAVAAEQLNRKWIACDLGRFAVHTTRKRLLSIPNVTPFVVQNLGKYERQMWAGAEFGEDSNQGAE